MASDKCPGCKGSKTVIKLGLMHGDCNTCSGKGYISVKKEEKAPTIIIKKRKPRKEVSDNGKDTEQKSA